MTVDVSFSDIVSLRSSFWDYKDRMRRESLIMKNRDSSVNNAFSFVVLSKGCDPELTAPPSSSVRQRQCPSN
ncbi:hypothetical protein TNCV_3355981 [Trichonephila clavipes]|nr:hypothetical protein TNCV_3355981 [Trichonephila clavipes]